MFDKRAPRNRNLIRIGSKADCVERILTTYVETGRTVRSLASLFGVSKSTVHRYVKNYAQDNAPSYLYREGRRVAQEHRCAGGNDTDDMGSLN